MTREQLIGDSGVEGEGSTVIVPSPPTTNLTHAAWEAHLRAIHAEWSRRLAAAKAAQHRDWVAWGCPRPPKKGEPAGPKHEWAEDTREMQAAFVAIDEERKGWMQVGVQKGYLK